MSHIKLEPKRENETDSQFYQRINDYTEYRVRKGSLNKFERKQYQTGKNTIPNRRNFFYEDKNGRWRAGKYNNQYKTGQFIPRKSVASYNKDKGKYVIDENKPMVRHAYEMIGTAKIIDLVDHTNLSAVERFNHARVLKQELDKERNKAMKLKKNDPQEYQRRYGNQSPSQAGLDVAMRRTSARS